MNQDKIPLCIELGKHWPESGDYQAWKEERLAPLRNSYDIFKVETFDTYTGGVLVLAYGYPKEKSNAAKNIRA